MAADEPISEFVQAVREASRQVGVGVPWEGLQRRIDQWARETPSLLVSAGKALREKTWVGEVGWLLKRMEETLAATPGLDQALATMEVARSWYVPARLGGRDRRAMESAEGYWPRAAERSRRLSALLAASQPAERVLEVLERLEDREEHFDMLCLLAHELVIRGERGDERPVLARLGREMRGRGHPLAALPLHRLELESEVVPLTVFHSADGGGYGGHAKRGARGELGPALPPSPGDPLSPGLVRARPALTDEERALMGKALEGAAVLAGARVEVGAFLIDPPFEEDDPELLLRSLSLRCLTEATAIRRGPTSPERALGALFGQAADGAEYNDGDGGAWGRLHAWTSLAALAGTDLSRGLTPVESLARLCRWSWFLGQSEWFQGVVNDGGILCERPTRSSAAVIAWSSSD